MRVGIETDRGPWVRALVAAGYTVIAVNPLQAARYRERLAVSGAKSDPADAHMLADMVRTDAHQLRPVAVDSAQAEAVKVVTRMHKTLIWERTRTTQRLRHALREYFPAAVEAFEDLDAADTLELLAKAPDPATAARLSLARSARPSSGPGAATSRQGRRDPGRAAGSAPGPARGGDGRLRGLGAGPGRPPGHPQRAGQAMEGQVEAHFGQHPDAEIIQSQPGLGPSSAPGCSPSSGTPPAGTPRPRPARTTPRPARSPAPRAGRRSSPPGSCTTTGSSTP